MNEFRFLSWKVYIDSKMIVKEISVLIDNFPQKFKYNLGDQLYRAAVSVVLSIAEGSGKNSDKELNRYFNIGLGSINETVAALDLALENNLISKSQFEELLEKLHNIAKQLGGFKKKISVISR